MFLDKLTLAFLYVKEDSDAFIKTNKLLALLEKAKSKGLTEQSNIENLRDVDRDVNYKKKVLDYLRSYNGAYENEFPKVIEILKDYSVNRYERARKLLYPKLETIKNMKLK